MAHLKESIPIAAPITDVHDFAADITKWPTWYVGLRELSIDGENAPGATIKLIYSFMGKDIPVTTKVTEHSRDASGAWHWKAEAEGGWQAWDYLRKEDGTLVRVEMELHLPRMLGPLVGRAVSLGQTLKNLKRLVEASMTG